MEGSLQCGYTCLNNERVDVACYNLSYDGVEGPSRGDPVKGWKIMGCSVRSDNLF